MSSSFYSLQTGKDIARGSFPAYEGIYPRFYSLQTGKDIARTPSEETETEETETVSIPFKRERTLQAADVVDS